MYQILMILLSDIFFFFNDTATTEIYTLSLHDALPILNRSAKEGARSSRHYDDEGVIHPPLEPRCVRPARSGRTCRDPRRSHRMLGEQGAPGEGAPISRRGEGAAEVR